MPKILFEAEPRQPTRAQQRRRLLRDQMWPGAEELIWHRKAEDGFVTVPRTVPLIGTLIRLLTKDLDASRPYLDLWARVFDEGVVEVLDEEELAASCGYPTPRRNVPGRIQDFGSTRVARGSTVTSSSSTLTMWCRRWSKRGRRTSRSGGSPCSRSGLRRSARPYASNRRVRRGHP